MPATHTYLKTHQISGTGMITNLVEESIDLVEKAAASSSGRAAKTLVKNGPLRVTLVATRKGTMTRRHHVAGPVTVQILRGRVRITTPRGREDLRVGSIMTMSAGVQHSHTALSDSVLLLTLVE